MTTVVARGAGHWGCALFLAGTIAWGASAEPHVPVADSAAPSNSPPRQLAGEAGVTNGLVKSEAKVWNKYPNSLLLRTRTAATYPAGLSVFTLVGTYQDFTEYRNPATHKMSELPQGMRRWQYTALFWGEYGLTDRTQLGIAVPFIDRRYHNDRIGLDNASTGLGDLSLYGKTKVVTETQWLPALTLDGFLKVPSGDEDEGLGNGEMDFTVACELSKRYSDYSLHINPEYTFTGGDRKELGATAEDRLRLNCGLMWHVTPKFLPVFEWNALWWGDVGDQHELGCGFLWFPFENVSIKLAVAVPVYSDQPWEVDWTPWIKIATWF